MPFWIFMFLMSLLSPLTMILIGRWFGKRPPKEISAAFGYRSSRSMKNQETWDYANRLLCRLWQALGWASLAPSLAGMALVFGRGMDRIARAGWILSMAQLFLLLASFIPIELALRKRFDKDGNKRP